MKKIALSIATALLSGCYTTPKQLCKNWIDSREIYSSYERCEACAKTLGTKDLHQIRTCTFKRDLESVR